MSHRLIKIRSPDTTTGPYACLRLTLAVTLASCCTLFFSGRGNWTRFRRRDQASVEWNEERKEQRHVVLCTVIDRLCRRSDTPTKFHCATLLLRPTLTRSGSRAQMPVHMVHRGVADCWEILYFTLVSPGGCHTARYRRHDLKWYSFVLFSCLAAFLSLPFARLPSHALIVE